MEFDRLKKIIVKDILGSASGEERRLLDEWRNQSEEHQRLYEKLVSGSFLEKAVSDNNKALRRREWKRLEARIVRRRGRSVRLIRFRVVAAVCILALGIGAVGLWSNSRQDRGGSPLAGSIRVGSPKAIVELAGGQQFLFNKDTTLRLEAQGIQLVSSRDTLDIIQPVIAGERGEEYNVVRIPHGGEYITRLPDGSVVHLNTGSELKVPVYFGTESREVWLRGEGFFEVVHRENLIFTVHTDKADISVLGTEFDVRAYTDEKEVVTTLVQGAVGVSSGRTYDRLKPGEQARIAGKGDVRVAEVDIYPFIAWKNGRMVFENERLEKIMAELQRWYDFELFYADPDVKEMHFTIDILKYEEISKVLNLMERMNKVKFTQKGRTVVVNSY
ncbi:fec operon regulator FecR [Odoribacter splanchnicus]|uniref:FecR family protein n=1 Tax=Odoribacter splanchnicus TaxID=28118 RepID=UPI000D980BFE|nr:FecR domain-containing protein [Odoribacter splanchnicus]SPY25355.1 fec operon regulator FecR [Odoribacter splanchnicus]